MTSEFAIAVHALVYLNHKDTVLSSDELAENICTNPARIRKVMAKLKKAGMVFTKEGIKGGYHAAEEIYKVNLRQICDALGIALVKTSWKSGSMDMDCMVSSKMSGVMDNIYDELDVQCRKYLETITIEDIDGKIFNAQKETEGSRKQKSERA